MKSPFYNTYLYKFSQNTTYESLDRDLQKLDKAVQISVHDISDLSLEEKIHTIDSMFIAERMRKYMLGKQRECYVNIVRYSELGYLAIISIYPEGDFFKNASDLFNTLCHTDVISYRCTSEDADSCKSRWSSYIKKFAQSRRFLNKRDYTIDSDNLFSIKIDGIDELKKQFESSPNRARALLTCAFARVMCAGTRTDSVIFEDHIISGMLTRIPLRVCDLTSEIPINEVSEAYGLAARYNDITQDELRVISKIDIDEYILYSQAVLYDRMFADIFKTSSLSKLYKFDAISIADTPLFVIFHMNGETASVQYYYDSSFFKNISVHGLHKSFEATLSKLIKKDYTVTDYNEYFDKKISNEDKQLKAIVACLKKSEWFAAYKETELVRLAKKCKVRRLFYRQNFIDANTRVDSVFLLVHGKTEIVGRDRDNILHTLLILKPGSAFGFESIAENRTSSVDYQVLTDDALAIVIDRELFLKEASTHNELFVKAIDIQNSNVRKFQKLWIMS